MNKKNSKIIILIMYFFIIFLIFNSCVSLHKKQITKVDEIDKVDMKKDKILDQGSSINIKIQEIQPANKDLPSSKINNLSYMKNKKIDNIINQNVKTNNFKDLQITQENKVLKNSYKVLQGDTLPLLAERYYGTKNAWIKIYQANRDKIQKGLIYPGQVLIIPR